VVATTLVIVGRRRGHGMCQGLFRPNDIVCWPWCNLLGVYNRSQLCTSKRTAGLELAQGGRRGRGSRMLIVSPFVNAMFADLGGLQKRVWSLYSDFWRAASEASRLTTYQVNHLLPKNPDLYQTHPVRRVGQARRV
jgi:hypothetical protein